MNNLYVLGRLYWIIRNTGRSGSPVISKGFMRQTSAPWLVGNGVQLRFGKYVVQFGFCGNPKELGNQDGLLYAIQGRLMDADPNEIGDWR